MKRLVLPTVFFFLLFFALPQPSDALVGDPSLYIIPAASIGVALLPVSTAATVAGLVLSAASISGSTYYAATGQDPVYAAASSVASAADALFVPAYQAFKANFVSPETFPASAAQYVGLESSVGAKIGDIVDFVKDSTSNEYDNLKSLIASNTSNDTYDLPQISTVGNIIATPAGPYKITSTNSSWISYYSPIHIDEIYKKVHSFADTSIGGWLVLYNGLIYHIFPYPSGGTGWTEVRRLYASPFVADPNQFPTPGVVNYTTLKPSLLSPSPDVANDIKEAVKDIAEDKKIVSSNSAPSAVPAPSQTAITNEQVNNFFTQNTSNVFNEYNNVANNVSSTYNDIEGAKAAAEFAKEQEEAEKKEETFPPIASLAFEEPYDPGPYDIPERFSSFLNTVKSSGLFSFSSSFFNSLPGGGSPVYQIEAGQYGSHTIDLSQTMSIGLAVLKTILLACFGFLSIRAVIMKR